MRQTMRAVAVLLTAVLATSLAMAAKQNIYQQDPAFRGIEYGSQPNMDDLELVDDTQAPILVYKRTVESPRLGVAQVNNVRYYFHEDMGFYKATLEFRHTQNENVFEELKRQFADPTQRLPMGEQTLILWLRPDYTAEMTTVEKGMSTLKVVSTDIGAELGE